MKAHHCLCCLHGALHPRRNSYPVLPALQQPPPPITTNLPTQTSNFIQNSLRGSIDLTSTTIPRLFRIHRLVTSLFICSSTNHTTVKLILALNAAPCDSTCLHVHRSIEEGALTGTASRSAHQAAYIRDHAGPHRNKQVRSRGIRENRKPGAKGKSSSIPAPATKPSSCSNISGDRWI